MKLYKVVARVNAEYFSATYGTYYNKAYPKVLKYSIGKTTTPAFGKIFCFGKYEDARSFAHAMVGMNEYSIMVGDGEVVSDDTRIVYCEAFATKTVTFLKKMWAGATYTPKTAPVWLLIHGTVLAESFTPKKILKHYR